MSGLACFGHITNWWELGLVLAALTLACLMVGVEVGHCEERLWRRKGWEP